MYNKNMKNKSGFTIMELLVVIAILLILIAIVLSSLSISQKRTRDDRRIATLQEIMLAVEEYRDVCREYPHSLIPTVNNGCTSANVTLANFLSADALNAVDQVDAPFQGIHKIKYVGIAGVGQSHCTGYHVGISLETEHPELSRADRADTADGFALSAMGAEICQPSTANGFSGNTDDCGTFFPGSQTIYKCLDFKKGNP